jgi:ABC-type branched-subunit amino acid transport system permease subunit
MPLTSQGRQTKMAHMKQSPVKYIVIAVVLLAVVGILAALAVTKSWTAFLAIALLCVVSFVFLSGISNGQESPR